jgi:hypothetical protein
VPEAHRATHAGAPAVELLKQAADAVWAQHPEVAEWLPALAPVAERAGEDPWRLRNVLELGLDADLWDPRADRVSLLTLHAAKGTSRRWCARSRRSCWIGSSAPANHGPKPRRGNCRCSENYFWPRVTVSGRPSFCRISAWTSSGDFVPSASMICSFRRNMPSTGSVLSW